MNRLKKHIVMGVILMTVVSGSMAGCTLPSVGKEKTEKALEKKYGEEFKVLSFNNPSLFQDYYSAEAYAVAYPEIPFSATVSENFNDVTDSYVTKRLCDRISEQLSKNIASLQDEYYIYTQAMLDDTLLTDPMISLEDYLKDSPGEEFTVHLFIEMKENSLEEIANALINLMNGVQNLNGSICLYLVDSESLQETKEYIESHTRLYQEFMDLTDKSYIGSVELNNSSFVLTTDKLREMAGGHI